MKMTKSKPKNKTLLGALLLSTLVSINGIKRTLTLIFHTSAHTWLRKSTTYDFCLFSQSPQREWTQSLPKTWNLPCTSPPWSSWVFTSCQICDESVAWQWVSFAENKFIQGALNPCRTKLWCSSWYYSLCYKLRDFRIYYPIYNLVYVDDTS